MTFNKKNLLGFVLVLMLLTVMSVVSANLIPTTAPCWVKGTVTSSDFNVDTLTVDAYLGDTLLKSSPVSAGVYDLNSLGANDGNTINLKVDGATFKTFTFVGYCNTSGHPWIVKDFSVSKQANGQSCSSDDICISAYCGDDNLCSDKPVNKASSGGAGAPSNQTQVGQIWPVVNAQMPVVMNITDDKLGLVQISLMLGITKENVRIKVSSLSGKPSSVPKLSGDIYAYLKINKTNFENGDLSKNASIKFKVKKSWLKENGFDSKDLALYHFTGTWDELSTKFLFEDDDFVYFEAKTPGFSYFAIAANKSVTTATKEVTNNSSNPVENKNVATTTNKDSNNQTSKTKTNTNRNTSSTIIIVVAIVIFILLVIYFFNKPKRSNHSMNHIHSRKHVKFKKHVGSKNRVRKTRSRK